MSVTGLPRKENIATKKGEWGTPPWLFGALDSIHHFEWDLSATFENALCHKFYAKGGNMETRFKDGSDYHCLGDLFDHVVTPENTNCFMNPDYSRGVIDKSMQQALILSEAYNNVIACLVPFCAHAWFKNYAMQAAEIQMIGRVHYVGYYTDGTLIDQSPSYDSCIVLFRPGDHSHQLSIYKVPEC